MVYMFTPRTREAVTILRTTYALYIFSHLKQRKGEYMSELEDMKQLTESIQENEDVILPVKSPPNPLGRPPKLTDGRIKAIVKALKNCQSQKSAAQAAGVSEKTFYNYIQKANEVREARELDPDAVVGPYDDRYIKLLEAIEKAESEIEANLIAAIKDAGMDGKWQALAWILERRWPEKWSQKSRLVGNVSVAENAEVVTVSFASNLPENSPGRKPEMLEAEIVDESE